MMQVKSIIIYSVSGKIREIPFRLNSLNVITGESGTGKSALIDIVDYCSGRSSFNVFEGVNRDVISWYAVIFTSGDVDLLVAKRPPKIGRDTCSEAFVRIGRNIGIPDYSELAINSNDDSVRLDLERISGFHGNVIARKEGDEEKAYSANLKHAKTYLFQPQNVVANQEVLFFNQTGEHAGFKIQAIKDTFPYFVGAVDEERLQKVASLRNAKSELSRLSKEILRIEKVAKDKSGLSERLRYEAIAVGLIDEVVVETQEHSVDQLKQALSTDVSVINPQAGDDLSVLQSRLREIEAEISSLREGIEEARQFAGQFKKYGSNLSRLEKSLEPIEFFNCGDQVLCPLCQTKLGADVSSFVSVLKQDLDSVRASVGRSTEDAPKLSRHITDLEYQENEKLILRDDLRDKIKVIIKSRRDYERSMSLRERAASVKGKISLFLEGNEELDAPLGLYDRRKQLQAEVLALEKELAFSELEGVISSRLRKISTDMTRLAEKLNLEFSGLQYSLDMKSLTVVVDNQYGPIPMIRQGSGKNWLACHVVTMLALHKCFSSFNTPVPRFMMFDQPSQVHFPDLSFYKSLSGEKLDDGDLSEVDVDIRAVRDLFRLFYDFCNEQLEHGGTQIIVTEHANINEPWFQKCLVEKPWREGRALIPEEWLSR